MPESSAELEGPGQDLVFEERIGSGGAAQVYRVRDLRLGRLFALKAYRRPVDDLSVRAAFELETRVATQLGTHPNIATVLGAGVSEGRPWLATELVEGGPLSRRLKGGPLPWAEALRVAITTAETLSWAHNLDAPVLHRDVTPANVLLDSFGRPILTDFGVSAAGHSPGRIAGYTPSYSAPEVLARGRYTAASEVWSVSAILHQMLTGSTPFRYDGRRGITAFVQQQKSRLPRLGEDVPEPLAELVRSGLHPDPEARPTSMLSLALRLRTVEAELGFTSTARTAGPIAVPTGPEARAILAGFNHTVVLPATDDPDFSDPVDGPEEVTADVRPEDFGDPQPEVTFTPDALGGVPTTPSRGLRAVRRRTRRPAPPVVAAIATGTAAVVIGLLLTVSGSVSIVAGGPRGKAAKNNVAEALTVVDGKPNGGNTNNPPTGGNTTPLPPWGSAVGDRPLDPTKPAAPTGTTPLTPVTPVTPVVPVGPVVPGGPVVPPVVVPNPPADPVVDPPVVNPPVDPPVDPPVVDPPVVDPPVVDPPVVDPPVVDPPVVDPPVVDPPVVDPPVVDPPVVDPPVVNPPDPDPQPDPQPAQPAPDPDPTPTPTPDPSP